MVAAREMSQSNEIDSLEAALQLHQAGRLDEAEAMYRRLLSVDPSSVDVHFNLGVARAQRGKMAEAIGCYSKAIEFSPEYAEAYYSLGNALRIVGRRDEAAQAYRQAVRLRPEHAEAWNNLGNLLKDAGRIDAALGCYRKTVELRPDLSTAFSAWLFTMNYHPGFTGQEMFEAHRQWNRIYAAPLAARKRAHSNRPEVGKRLRVGYVSGDFKDHAASFFIHPILETHDRRHVEVFCYNTNPSYQEGSNAQQVAADHWRAMASASDAQMVDVIRRDGIDILVDLSGHTAFSRLTVFAQKPAPVQISYLGYPNTTGLSEIDFRLTDSVADPATEGGDQLYSERLLRVPDCAWCYRPPVGAPEVSALPAAALGGKVTFGSFNARAKINAQTVAVWAGLLKVMPNSRLLIKALALRDESVRRELRQMFEAQGIGGDRLAVVGPTSGLVEHLQAYHQVDIALDTFPYNGTTTTCEALWMGVPVVTLAGTRHASRVGASLLHFVGLDDFVCSTPEQYIQRAALFAGNVGQLAELRRSLRPHMEKSILTNAVRFTRGLEAAYRFVWKNWCDTRGATANVPATVQAMLAQGLEHHQAGRLKEAEAVYRSILSSDPTQPDAHFNLGIALAQQGRTDDAIACYSKAIEFNPAHADAYYSLGNALRLIGKRDEAIEAYRQAISLRPTHAAALNNLANLLKDAGQVEEAVDAFKRALELKPDLAETHYNLGSTLAGTGRLEEAIACYNRAAELKPDAAEYHSHLAGALREQGKLDEAMDSFRNALAANPRMHRIHSALLFTMTYHPGMKPQEVFEAHREWDERHARPLAEHVQPHLNLPEENRRLRVGYVSGDFREHAVAFFVEPILASHDREAFEIVGYFTNPVGDQVTSRLRKYADKWRNVATLGEQQLAQLIREDGIDILIDLSGHTAHNRLLVFALKPAPVQINYLGYPNTTGLEAMDYRLTDAIADPEGESDRLCSEKLLRLPGCGWCYRPPTDAPDVWAPPSTITGAITFGSLNNRIKINEQTIAVWSDLLKRVPDSRLLIKARALRDESVRRDLAKAFGEQGIETERLTLLPPRAFVEHLQTYQEIDVALDTFPYNGTTTTCEALWMGVPVVTLSGQTHASRVGASLLHAVGLEELVCHSPEEYVDRAAELAGDAGRLAALRGELRQRMASSALMDATGFTRNLEERYRQAWRNWCASSEASEQGSDSPQRQIQRGHALLANRRTDEAIKRFKRALELAPDNPEALYGLGNAAQDQGRHQDAIGFYEKALEHKPDWADAHYNLANALRACVKLPEAMLEYERALALKPDHVAALINLGNTYQDLKRRDDAVASYRRAVEVSPDQAFALNNLGSALREAGEFDESIRVLRRAVELMPEYPEAHYNLGNALHSKGKLEEAVASFRKALEFRPDSHDTLNNLGNALEDLGRLDEAIEYYDRAMAQRPDSVEALSNTGNVMTALGNLDEAIRKYRRALELRPEASTVRSSLAFAINYSDQATAQEVFDVHREWQIHHAAPLAEKIKPHRNRVKADRRLRIGYVSGDFRQHSVAFFIGGVIAAHDHRTFEIFCYYTRAAQDPITDQIRKAADQWRDVAGMADDRLADRIREDEIDILVDLAGHTAHNRLLMFAQKPAPVQITYLGYPNTTGLDAMDYRITDALADPPGETEAYYSEKLIRLPDAFFCYRPARSATPVGPLPARNCGYVTFASLNNFAKVTPRVLELWAQILAGTPQSRLVMVAPDHPDVRLRVTDALARAGVEADRAEFLRRQTMAEYYKLYGRLDIALDPFPFNGHTTTCDCLWMGVPVVSLVGKTAAGRAGVSVLTNMGLEELLAETPEQYVKVAIDLAGDLPRLAKLRAGLRPRMQKSGLMDSRPFTRKLEAAYRQAWRNWCESQRKD